MSEEPRPRIQRPADPQTTTQDGLSSFAVWSRTTMLGDEDDAELAENGVFLRGID